MHTLKRIRILLADDHKIVRECLSALLQSEPDMDVIGQDDNGLLVADMVTGLRPDVLVLDLMMPGLNGLEVTRQVCKRSPQVRIIVLSMHGDENYVLEALRNGAAAYMIKDSHVENLIGAIRTAERSRPFHPTLSHLTLPTAFGDEILLSTQDLYESVTPREREVLQLAAEGNTNSDIAERLSISRRTAELHRTRVLTKLHIHNQTGLVKFALRKGLISLEQEPSQ